MNNKVLKILNPILLLVVVGQIITGLSLLFFDNDRVIAVHKIFGLTLILVLSLHLYFNFWWLKNYFKKAL